MYSKRISQSTRMSLLNLISNLKRTYGELVWLSLQIKMQAITLDLLTQMWITLVILSQSNPPSILSILQIKIALDNHLRRNCQQKAPVLYRQEILPTLLAKRREYRFNLL